MTTECPNCGSRTSPRAIRYPWTTYYSCVRCDFSTWTLDEYRPGLMRAADRSVIGQKDMSDREFLALLLREENETR